MKPFSRGSPKVTLAAARARLKDVADRAGVSPATVSRVLNGVPSVVESNRTLVLQAVEQLGYRPNRVGRNLRRQRTEMIGVVVSDIENPHFATMVRAVEDAAYTCGRRVLLCNTDENPAKQRMYLEELASERVLGVILSATEPRAEAIRELLDLGIAVVAFDRPVADRRADGVFVDNASGTRRATEHLLSAGHQKIGFIGGPAGVVTADQRLAGYEAAMREAGRETLVADGRFRMEGGRVAAELLIERDETLSALIVANNLMSLGVLETLRRTDRLQTTALVAIDDPFWSTVVEPALTVLAQPVKAMSRSAVELLFERMSGERSEPRRLVFDLELRVRDSCHTAPAGHWRSLTGDADEPVGSVGVAVDGGVANAELL